MMPPAKPGRRAAVVAALLLAPLDAAHALTLSQAEHLLESRNAEIRLGGTAVASAEGGLATAGQRPNPTLNAQTVNIDPDRGVGPGPLRNKTVDTTLGLQWLVERGDKREKRVDAARSLLDAARLDLFEARRAQRLALHLAYFDLKQAESRVQVLRDTEKLARGQLEAIERRVAAGDAAPVERARLAVEAVRAANDSRAADADLTAARETLSAVLGHSIPAEALSADDDWPEIGALPPLSAVDRALRRPDVLANAAREAAANNARAVAESQAVRDVTVGAQVERFPPDMRRSYGLTLSVPLFVSHAYEGDIVRARAEAEAARISRERAEAQARSEALKSRSQLASSQERLDRLVKTGMPAAEAAARGVEFAYARGAASLTDLLDARRQLRATQFELVQARADLARAWATWRAGTEWETQP
jgi:cobalt-zinc-cadmium efflux system outer membrane protein